MNFKIPDDQKDFFKYIWKIIGIRQITKEELIYKVSYKMNLPYRPTIMNKKLNEAIANGYLVKVNNNLTLSEELLTELKKEIKTDKKMFPFLFPIQNKRDRIEDNIDSWRYQQKSKRLDSIKLMKTLLTRDEIVRGQKVSSQKIHYKNLDEKNLLLEAEIDGSKGEIYTIKIDIKNKMILHDCHDYIHNRMKEKKLCKHFFRTILDLQENSPQLFVELLDSLKGDRDTWNFMQQT